MTNASRTPPSRGNGSSHGRRGGRQGIYRLGCVKTPPDSIGTTTTTHRPWTPQLTVSKYCVVSHSQNTFWKHHINTRSQNTLSKHSLSTFSITGHPGWYKFTDLIVLPASGDQRNTSNCSKVSGCNLWHSFQESLLCTRPGSPRFHICSDRHDSESTVMTLQKEASVTYARARRKSTQSGEKNFTDCDDDSQPAKKKVRKQKGAKKRKATGT